jgi:ribosomal protein L11 methyltransferase
LIRLAIRVRRDQAELVLAELLELAPSGVEETAVSAEVIEYALYGPPGEVPTMPDLRAAAGGALVEVSSTELADDWLERWREFHQPLVLDERLTVRPPWEPPASTELDIVIDPGQAFGTGAHATTRMSLELLLGLDATGPLVDLGCGSGVLAIAGARLGFDPVLALDNDPVAIEATRRNALANAVTVEVRRADLRTDLIPTAPTVTANLLTPLLVQWVGSVESAVERVIASGILVGEADDVAADFSTTGLGERVRLRDGDWVALLLER